MLARLSSVMAVMNYASMCSASNHGGSQWSDELFSNAVGSIIVGFIPIEHWSSLSRINRNSNQLIERVSFNSFNLPFNEAAPLILRGRDNIAMIEDEPKSYSVWNDELDGVSADDDENATNNRLSQLSSDVIAVILSFFDPNQWGFLKFIQPDSFPRSIGLARSFHFERSNAEVVPVDEQESMQSVMNRVFQMDRFRGILRFSDEVLMIKNHPSSDISILSPFTGECEITALNERVEWPASYSSGHSDWYFYHRSGMNDVCVRNILTDQIIPVGPVLKARMISDSEFLASHTEGISFYRINTEHSRCEIIGFFELKSRIHRENWEPFLSADDRDVSVVYHDLIHHQIRQMDLRNGKISIIKQVRMEESVTFTPDGSIILTESEFGSSITHRSYDRVGLEIPLLSVHDLKPSPDSRKALGMIKEVLKDDVPVMVDLYSGEITVLSKENVSRMGWVSKHLFFYIEQSSQGVRSNLRCVQDPSFDFRNSNYWFDPKPNTIGSVRSLLMLITMNRLSLDIIGPNLLYFGKKKQIVQIRPSLKGEETKFHHFQ